MRYVMHVCGALLAIAFGFPVRSQAAQSSQRALEEELKAKYPDAPKQLDTDPATSAVLLVDFELKGAMSRLDGVALVAGDSGGAPIRAARMQGDLVLFHTLVPGTYSLRFLRVENYNPAETLVFEKPLNVEISVTVTGAGTHYLGTVVATRKKPRITLSRVDFKPPDFQLTYDRDREIKAWSAFKRKYAASPWATLADSRIAALRSPQGAQRDTVALAAAPARDAAQGDPLGTLAGGWGLTVFVMGAGQFGGPKCGTSDRPGPPPVTIAPPSDGAVSLSAPCDDGSEYAFRLKHDTAAQGYVITVKSKEGISVDDFPVAYTHGRGWRGARDVLIGGETQSVTAMVSPIEGRNWYGWMIAVLPTSGVGHEDDLKKPFFRADITRRK